MRPEEEAPLTSEKEPVTEVQMDYREVYPAVTEPVQEEGERTGTGAAGRTGSARDPDAGGSAPERGTRTGA